MNVVLALDKFSMTLVIVSGAVFFIILLVFFYFLFLRNRALAHQVKELSRRYDYLHSLLTNQDSKHIDRIEEISQINSALLNISFTPVWQSSKLPFTATTFVFLPFSVTI